jgi:NiFe hydrogenase small subunit HydA
MNKSTEVFDRLEMHGVSRRDFMKFCGVTAAVLGMGSGMAAKVAEAVTSAQRPPVVWLHFAECTGCSESLLRATYPSAASIILDTISLDYHETLMAAAGHQAEEILHNAVSKNKGKFLCICEGAVLTKDNGVWGKIGGHTFLEVAKDVVPKAMATCCVGNCACFGGVQAAEPNPTGAVGVGEATGVKTVNISGCPPNAINIVATLVHVILLGKLPALDDNGRPLFAYGKTIHDICPRRAMYEEGKFAKAFGDEGHMQGYCLEKLGCKGPYTYNNCPQVLFNEGTNWPIGAGHPCIGCSEPQFWDEMAPFFEEKA